MDSFTETIVVNLYEFFFPAQRKGELYGRKRCKGRAAGETGNEVAGKGRMPVIQEME